MLKHLKDCATKRANIAATGTEAVAAAGSTSTATATATAAAAPVARLPHTANFHFIKGCNFRCRYCYATFCDSTGARNILPHAQLLEITQKLARRFSKITFVGGEPTLYRRLPEMLAAAKAEGALTNVVTNGTLIDAAWLAANANVLDFLTLSADSDRADTLAALGRAAPNRAPLDAAHYIALAEAARAAGIRVKVNTVVTRLNDAEDIAAFIRAIAPARWKILQAAPVAGQNDAHIAALTPARPAFDAYVARHTAALAGTGIRVVPEPIETIRGSYVMVDPQGRFFDSVTGTHHYSRPILDAGLDAAFAEVAFDPAKFDARGGAADYAASPATGGAADSGSSAEVRSFAPQREPAHSGGMLTRIHTHITAGALLAAMLFGTSGCATDRNDSSLGASGSAAAGGAIGNAAITAATGAGASVQTDAEHATAAGTFAEAHREATERAAFQRFCATANMRFGAGYTSRDPYAKRAAAQGYLDYCKGVRVLFTLPEHLASIDGDTATGTAELTNLNDAIAKHENAYAHDVRKRQHDFVQDAARADIRAARAHYQRGDGGWLWNDNEAEIAKSIPLCMRVMRDGSVHAALRAEASKIDDMAAAELNSRELSDARAKGACMPRYQDEIAYPLPSESAKRDYVRAAAGTGGAESNGDNAPRATPFSSAEIGTTGNAAYSGNFGNATTTDPFEPIVLVGAAAPAAAPAPVAAPVPPAAPSSSLTPFPKKLPIIHAATSAAIGGPVGSVGGVLAYVLAESL
jgi:radical S-adenosyl methionine domain-containing protein 2